MVNEYRDRGTRVHGRGAFFFSKLADYVEAGLDFAKERTRTVALVTAGIVGGGAGTYFFGRKAEELELVEPYASVVRAEDEIKYLEEQKSKTLGDSYLAFVTEELDSQIGDLEREVRGIKSSSEFKDNVSGREIYLMGFAISSLIGVLSLAYGVREFSEGSKKD